MSYLQQLHEERKARLNRIYSAGIRNVPETVIKKPVQKISVSTESDVIAGLRAQVARLRDQIELMKDHPEVGDLGFPQGLPDSESSPLTIAKIKREVAFKYRVTVDELECERRSKDIVRPRQIAMYLCAKLTKKSLPYIGERFGGRDHTTVMHAREKIKVLRRVDPELNADLLILEDTLSK